MIGDTDFFIDLMKTASETHDRARAKAEEIDPSGIQLRMTAITRFELARGAGLFHDPDAEWTRIGRILASFPTLPFDGEAADLAGQIHARLQRAGTPIGMMDALIAATAMRHAAPLVTRNAKDFERVEGLAVETY